MKQTPDLSRRSFFALPAGAAAAATLTARSPAADPPKGPFALGKLPYAADALEPHIDARTMEIHHGKHHAAYVAKLNEAVADLATAPPPTLTGLISGIKKLPDKMQSAVRNNGGGHYNHDLFWKLMGKPGTKGVGGEPSGKIGPAIVKAFGSFAAFQQKFADAAAKRFGSGWAWLLQKEDGSLAVTSTPNQDNPLMQGVVAEAETGKPLLGLDVWEHAYYLKYQNLRAKYVEAWWNVVNWSAVDECFTA